MTTRRYAPVALACALALGLSGCGGEDTPDPRLKYSVTPSVEVPPADAGTESSVETVQQTCTSTNGQMVEAPVPLAWDVGTNETDKCEWSTGDATITLTYGEIPDNEDDAWKSVIDQHQTAQLKGTLPGYRFTRYTEDEGGGPLWHYRYIDTGVEGAAYTDSLNLYRDGWLITYEAESTSYNTYLADRLISNAGLI